MSDLPHAAVERRRPFNVIWIIPIVVAIIGLYLGWRAVERRGPTITIHFQTADGITAGQTEVRHKAVPLGTVTSVNLSRDMKSVEVRVQMRAAAERFLTDQAQFWVVRARFNVGNISGLDTLVSGAFIELDPGTPDDHPKRDFVGLENPPAIRSDEPGRTYTLQAQDVGQLGSGSPVFFRDIAVGEVIGYHLDPRSRSVAIQVFVRAPFDQYVYNNTRFWNVSGASLELGSQGVQLHIASLQAVISGGIAFDVPKEEQPGQPAPAAASYTLFPSQADADAAGYRQKIPVVTYIDGSVRGLAVGAPVDLYGIQIGTVTRIALEFDQTGAKPRVAVHMEIEPERIPEQANQPLHEMPAVEVARRMVAEGMRLQLETSNFLTGQLFVSLAPVPDAPPAQVTMQGDEIVVPSAPGSLEGIQSGLSDVVAKLARLPLDDIAKNLNDTLAGTRDLTQGPELRKVLTSAAATMADLQSLIHKADSGATPALNRLPEIAANLQSAVGHADRLLGSLDTGYGPSSDFHQSLQRLLDQLDATGRAVQLFATYLTNHPEALVFGRRGP